MNKITEKYINYCRLFLGEDANATDEMIDNAINNFAWMFENQKVNKEEEKMTRFFYNAEENICADLCYYIRKAIKSVDEKNNALFASYQELADKEENVIFGGRLGEYKYYDMDKAILRAIELFEELGE